MTDNHDSTYTPDYSIWGERELIARIHELEKKQKLLPDAAMYLSEYMSYLWRRYEETGNTHWQEKHTAVGTITNAITRTDNNPNY